MGGADGKKKIVVAGLASILLVAMVVAVVVGVSKKSSDGEIYNNTPPTATTNKAVQAICSQTTYSETCESSLSQANTTDTKELIKLTFDITVQGISDVLKNSTLLKEAAKDPAAKEALFVCQDVLEVAIDDLRRSFDRLGELEITKLSEYTEDLRVWLSAVVNNQETCIDAFENTTGDTGEKMKELMKTVKEMSINGLTMVTEMSSLIGQLQLGSFAGRRLMSEVEAEEPPRGWHRRLMEAKAKPDVVVAMDGSGQFKTINEAFDAVPLKNEKPFVIYVKEGLYKEYVVVPKKKNNIIFIGDGPLKTRITGDKNYAAGTRTYETPTFVVAADNFFAKDIGIENTAGPEGHQAVALRASGDAAVFFNVHIDGNQDTLYAHNYRQFYRNCQISGTIDFVFGDARAIFQNCNFIVRNPLPNQACMVTAQGRNLTNSTGAFIIQNSRIVAEPAFLAAKPVVAAFLGRPWKAYSRTIIMNTHIESFIAPEGWAIWPGTDSQNTCYYAEYKNKGPGSDTSKRVTWPGIKKISQEEAMKWKSALSIDDGWIVKTGIPYAKNRAL